MKYTRAEFITMAAKHGVFVKSIGAKYVDADTPGAGADPTGDILPNQYNYFVIRTSYYSVDLEGNKITVFDALDREGGSASKIQVIKILRGIFGIGLKDTKDIVDANWERWTAEPEIRLIRATPRKDLPLLLGSLKHKVAVIYLEDRMKGIRR